VAEIHPIAPPSLGTGSDENKNKANLNVVVVVRAIRHAIGSPVLRDDAPLNCVAAVAARAFLSHEKTEENQGCDWIAGYNPGLSSCYDTGSAFRGSPQSLQTLM
jgi:hypothetical protein